MRRQGDPGAARAQKIKVRGSKVKDCTEPTLLNWLTERVTVFCSRMGLFLGLFVYHFGLTVVLQRRARVKQHLA